MQFSVPESQKFSIPLFAINPSRIVQFMNMLSPADMFDEEEIFQVKDDLISECKKFGEIMALEIPKP
jgi:splicing factor U2AF subunit